MARKAADVYRAGLELDPDERAVVAHRLLASLHWEDKASQPEIDAAWRDEVGTRVDDILTGEVNRSTFEQTRAQARALVGGLRT
ncbi:addiction module protein [Georgenia sp. TF02-10]|uniref:addiction module protein n=1 Tax=Georgenia sp. TF02-10 TaxID=2917725 RepID=UPI001FA747FD|nr:addiction module protein [Georgenia sp. TF02-10]UNX54479.1 addiction module protein [Georgenia sp. TF02-10]